MSDITQAEADLIATCVLLAVRETQRIPGPADRARIARNIAAIFEEIANAAGSK